MMFSATHWHSVIYFTGWAKETGLFLRVNNFATFNGRKVRNMLKVSKFCLEKEYYLHISEFKYSLPSLYKYSLPLHRVSADGRLTLFKAVWFLLLFQNFVKLNLTRNYNKGSLLLWSHCRTRTTAEHSLFFERWHLFQQDRALITPHCGLPVLPCATVHFTGKPAFKYSQTVWTPDYSEWTALDEVS